jgi:HEPN domain-containing protein
MRNEAEAWLKISAEDLQAAEILLERKLFRMACYHAQQSIEKIMKAILTDREIDFPRTHNRWTSIMQ